MTEDKFMEQIGFIPDWSGTEWVYVFRDMFVTISLESRVAQVKYNEGRDDPRGFVDHSPMRWPFECVEQIPSLISALRKDIFPLSPEQLWLHELTEEVGFVLPWNSSSVGLVIRECPEGDDSEETEDEEVYLYAYLSSPHRFHLRVGHYDIDDSFAETDAGRMKLIAECLRNNWEKIMGGRNSFTKDRSGRLLLPEVVDAKR